MSEKIHGTTVATPLKVTPESIGARPNTWLPTIAEIGAAPAGFGLGNAEFFTADKIDTLTAPGWYYTNNDMTLGGFLSARWIIHVSAYSNGATYCVQKAYPGTSYAFELVRYRYNGTWGEWEYTNPPMAAGVEYRTTERYNGKAVYAKLVELGNLPNASTKDVQFTDDARNVFPISLETQIGSGVANLHTTQTDDMYINLVNYRYVRVVTSVNRSNMIGRAIVKYYYT